MLRTRIITALAALCVVVAALFLLPPSAFAVAVLALLALGAHEWARLARLGAAAQGAFVGLFAAIGLALVFVPAARFAGHWPRTLLLGICGAATLFWLLVATPWVVRRWQVRGPMALALAGLVVLVGAFVAIVALRGHSPWTLLAAMAIVWIADTAAYFTGRALGRHKLAPQVSPGKTWEGLAGGLAAVALYALALLLLAPQLRAEASQPAGAVGWVVLAVAVAALSAVGDLFESWQKRQAGMKDSGTLLPGHGGVLDRIDALVAAMPPLALAAALWLPA
jgi:phosphatidate cytidylyltransferase